MPAKSTSDHYGSVAVTIHWLSAILILVLIGSGFRAGGIEDTATKAAVLRVHVPVGVAVLLLTLTRIVWWLLADKKPASLPMPKWQDVSARAMHLLFYIVILGMAASGIGMMVFSGAGTILFAGAEGPLPDFWGYKPRVPHGIGARLMVAAFVLHAGAALYHHFILRDGLMKRIWYGIPSQSVNDD